MDHELKSFLDGMEARIVSRVDALGNQVSNLKARVEALETRIDQSEARPLAEFWTWAKSSDLKSRAHSENVGFINSRLSAVEQRITAIELRGRIVA